MIFFESIITKLRPIKLKYNQFIKFGAVGTLGFLIDTAVLYISLYLFGFGYYSGRLLSYLCASTVTWYSHRIYTFNLSNTQSKKRELLRFYILNSFGGVVNYLIYALLIANYSVFREQPVMAVAIGAIFGMSINYYLSKKIVYRI